MDAAYVFGHTTILYSSEVFNFEHSDSCFELMSRGYKGVAMVVGIQAVIGHCYTVFYFTK